MMQGTVTLSKWGNSQGILISKDFCDQMMIKPGDKLDINFDGKQLTLKPKSSYSIESLMVDYKGLKPKEYDWGKPMGKELW